MREMDRERKLANVSQNLPLREREGGKSSEEQDPQEERLQKDSNTSSKKIKKS